MNHLNQTVTVLLMALPAMCSGCGHTEPAIDYDYVTFDVGLPENARVIGAAHGQTTDAYTYLIFDATRRQIAEFAAQYSGGVALSQYHTSRLKLHGAAATHSWSEVVTGIPWDLRRIKDGRFFRRDDTNGYISIDMTLNRVYVFR